MNDLTNLDKKYIKKCIKNLKLIIPLEIADCKSKIELYEDYFLSMISEKHNIDNCILGVNSQNGIIDLNESPFDSYSVYFYGDYGEGVLNFEAPPTYFEIWKSFNNLALDYGKEYNIYIEEFFKEENKVILSKFIITS